MKNLPSKVFIRLGSTFDSLLVLFIFSFRGDSCLFVTGLSFLPVVIAPVCMNFYIKMKKLDSLFNCILLKPLVIG